MAESTHLASKEPQRTQQLGSDLQGSGSKMGVCPNGDLERSSPEMDKSIGGTTLVLIEYLHINSKSLWFPLWISSFFSKVSCVFPLAFFFPRCSLAQTAFGVSAYPDSRLHHIPTIDNLAFP